MITIQHHVLSRIVALSIAACQDGSSSVLSGVGVSFSRDECTVAATDGKIAVEEVHRIPSSVESDLKGIISPQAIKRLRVWLALRQRARRNVPYSDLTLRADKASSWTVSDDLGENIVLRLVEGHYPAVHTALDNESEPSSEVFGLNAAFVTMLDKIWGHKRDGYGVSSGIVVTPTKRGLRIIPLRPYAIRERALIMPITLPK